MHQHATIQTIPPMHLPENVPNRKSGLLHEVKMLPKWGKPTNHDISSEGS